MKSQKCKNKKSGALSSRERKVVVKMLLNSQVEKSATRWSYQLSSSLSKTHTHDLKLLKVQVAPDGFPVEVLKETKVNFDTKTREVTFL